MFDGPLGLPPEEAPTGPLPLDEGVADIPCPETGAVARVVSDVSLLTAALALAVSLGADAAALSAPRLPRPQPDATTARTMIVPAAPTLRALTAPEG